MMHEVRDIKLTVLLQLNTRTYCRLMDSTVPDLNSQFTCLDSWLFHASSDHGHIPTLTPPRNSEVLPSHDAALMNELFFERIVPNIGDVIQDLDLHAPGPGHYAGPSLDHSLEVRMENLSEVPQRVAPIQPVDEDHIVITFAAQHRGMSFIFDPLLLHYPTS